MDSGLSTDIMSIDRGDISSHLDPSSPLLAQAPYTVVLQSEQEQKLVQVHGRFSSDDTDTESTFYEEVPERPWSETEYLPDENRSIRLIDPSTLSSIDLSEIEIGKRFAVGGEAHMYWGVWKPYCMKVVVKVFEVSRVSIVDLQMWRRQMQKMISLGLSGEPDLAYVCRVLGFCITKDYRRYVILEPLGCDLRTLIDVRMRTLSEEPPFSYKCTLGLMLFIALGVRALHRHGMVHGDLDSINVLFKDSMQIHDIADLNIVIGLPSLMKNGIGTGFWGAPEVLQGIREDIAQKSDVFAFAMLCHEILTGHIAQESDVYSFGMLCYEILTGHITQKSDVYSFAMLYCEIRTGNIPFEGHLREELLVLSGHRPCLPPYVSRDVRELLQRCWHKDPHERPNFSEIVPAIHYQLLNLCQAEMYTMTSVRESTKEDTSGTFTETFRIFNPPLPSQVSLEESKDSQETSDANSEYQRDSGSQSSIYDGDDVPVGSNGVA